jgi:hypothetical protein
MRAPHFLILDHFTFSTLSSGSLSVLRVLTKQTLEISTEVKDPSFLDPILAKVVKYSTLTILSSSDLFQQSFVKQGTLLKGFLQSGHTVQ